MPSEYEYENEKTNNPLSCQDYFFQNSKLFFKIQSYFSKFKITFQNSKLFIKIQNYLSEFKIILSLSLKMSHSVAMRMKELFARVIQLFIH